MAPAHEQIDDIAATTYASVMTNLIALLCPQPPTKEQLNKFAEAVRWALDTHLCPRPLCGFGNIRDCRRNRNFIDDLHVLSGRAFQERLVKQLLRMRVLDVPPDIDGLLNGAGGDNVGLPELLQLQPAIQAMRAAGGRSAGGSANASTASMLMLGDAHTHAGAGAAPGVRATSPGDVELMPISSSSAALDEPR
jgi:hypothetical protein